MTCTCGHTQGEHTAEWGASYCCAEDCACVRFELPRGGIDWEARARKAEAAVNSVQDYLNRCRILRQEPTTAGLSNALRDETVHHPIQTPYDF